MRIDLSYTWGALPRLLEGALITVQVSLAAMAIGTVLALLLTLFRVGGTRAGRMTVSIFISYVRGTPLLVQILLVFYAVAALGLELSPIAAGVVALAISSAAFTTEIIRGGLAAVPPGQIEAALSLGLKRLGIWWRVILPQVFQLVLPPLVNEFTQVIKATPLVSVIAVVEMMRIAQQIYNENYRPFEVMLGVAIIFFAMNFILARIAAMLERRNTLKMS